MKTEVYVRRGLGILVAIIAVGCGGSDGPPAGPTSNPPPGPSAFALSGTVRDSQTNSPLATVGVQILDGPAANRSTATDASGNYSFTNLTPAGFNVRFSRSGYTGADRGVNLTQDTRLDVTLGPVAAPPSSPPAATVPAAPTGLTAAVSGSTVSFNWNAVTNATQYLIFAGTSSGSSSSLSANTSQTTFTWSNVSAATYYARVQARNSVGTSNSSNEVQFTVSTTGGGGGGTPPSSWPGPLPPRSGGNHPVCQVTLPAIASCVNDIVGQPQAICDDSRYSCSTGSGTCSGHGGVYCWRN